MNEAINEILFKPTEHQHFNAHKRYIDTLRYNVTVWLLFYIEINSN